MKIKARKGDTFRKYSEWFQLPVQLLIDSNPHIRQEPILEGTEVAICGYPSFFVRSALFAHKEAGALCP